MAGTFFVACSAMDAAARRRLDTALDALWFRPPALAEMPHDQRTRAIGSGQHGLDLASSPIEAGLKPGSTRSQVLSKADTKAIAP